ncbi:MAG: phosphoribosyl-AMP cyclohydrolase [Anderseniella sp.]
MPGSIDDVEEGNIFAPRFNSDGLLPAIVLDATTSAPLMFAFMNEEALRLTINTGFSHFYSRSRKALWKKGETSGQLQHVKRIRTDCDQDVVVLEVEVSGDGAACHTGRATCFYRALDSNGRLITIDGDKLINAEKVYGKSAPKT